MGDSTMWPPPVTTPDSIADSPSLVADWDPDECSYSYSDLDAESDTLSLQSCMTRYRKENGRTYHAYKDGSYVLPNDEIENERLDIQHELFIHTWGGKLHVAPLEKEVHRVLDAGCGTGIWAIEFADENPEVQVTGVDLSPIQPPFVPLNARFFIDDLEDEWNFSKPFDFIFARFMTGSILDWPKFFQQSFDNLTPGGVIELQDIIYPMCSDDDTLPDCAPLKYWSDMLNDAFRNNGRPMDTALYYEKQLAEAGFVDIRLVQEKWPTNHWPKEPRYKELGILNNENLAIGLSSLSLAVFTRPEGEGGLGWSEKELQVLFSGVRKDLRDTSIHAYWRIHAVYARKPEEAE